jgi:hypothetical protein
MGAAPSTFVSLRAPRQICLSAMHCSANCAFPAAAPLPEDGHFFEGAPMGHRRTPAAQYVRIDAAGQSLLPDGLAAAVPPWLTAT